VAISSGPGEFVGLKGLVAGVLQAEETRSLESQREIEKREAKHG